MSDNYIEEYDRDRMTDSLARSVVATLIEPTEENKKANHYRKGTVRFHGLVLRIENPKGSLRSGIDPSGAQWENLQRHHYGYIQGTESNDGDEVDIYLGDDLHSQLVFVIDQVNDDGSFDEHKVMLGFSSKEDARDGYHRCYYTGWTGLGCITETTIDGLVEWLSLAGKNDKPFYKHAAALSTNDVAITLEHDGNLGFKPIEAGVRSGWYISPDYPPFAANKEGSVMNINTGNTTFGSADDRGYLRVSLYDKTTRTKKDYKVHRVVCSAFHGPQPASHYDVGHKNDNRSDNRPDNLEWVTHYENMKRANMRRRGATKDMHIDLLDAW